MKARRPWMGLGVLLLGLWASGAALAGGVELWEGESTSRSASKNQVVRGSVSAVSSKPGVATVSKPKGDNAQITITGVKEGEATITITGKQVVYNVGVDQKSLRTEEPFTAYIDVVVKKPEEVVKLAVLMRNQQMTVDFPKNMRMVTGTLKNSNKKVCRVHVNTSRKVTIFGRKKGTSTVTVKLEVTKKGKTKTVRGIIYVEVKEKRAKAKERRIHIGWDDLFIGRVVILNGGGVEEKRKPKKPETDDQARVVTGDGAIYVAVEADRNGWCTLDPGSDPTVVAVPTPGPVDAVTSEPGQPTATTVPSEPIATTTPAPSEAPPAWTVAFKGEETALEDGRLATAPLAGASVKLDLGDDPALARGEDTGFDQDPISGVTDSEGVWEVSLTSDQVVAYGLAEVAAANPAPVETLDLTAKGGKLVHMSADPRQSLHAKLLPYLRTVIPMNGAQIAVLSYPRYLEGDVENWIGQSSDVEYAEDDRCRRKKGPPDDPFFGSRNSWEQGYDDQWAIKRVGFTADRDSAWNRVGTGAKPVVVAVIDTGIDWNHADFSWENLWINEREIRDNGKDDDGNGFADDLIGWNFVADDNKPWDRDGHGTFVAGVIAATSNNGVGIAGINPHARIMVLKALNNFGHTRVSFLTQAILYAVENGARVINLSVGDEAPTRTEQQAIDYAHSKGVVVVAAAGNEGADVSGYGPAGLDHVITVAVTDFQDRRPAFSNWGAGIDITAPGVDVLSLRARRTDLMRDIPGVAYQPGRAYVGADKRYYRGAGSSFATPIVAGTASLLLAKSPELSPDQVKRVLLQSARDIEVPGVDQYTGYGLLDARAALAADPDFEVVVRIDRAEVVRRGGAAFVQVTGSADGDRFRRAWLEIGAGEQPRRWKKVGEELARSVRSGVLGEIPATEFRGSKLWMVRIVVEHQNGRTREMRFQLNLGS